MYLLFLVVAFTTTKAQTIDTAALQGYSKSVILKVFDVAYKTALTTSEQTTLADLFQDEEDELAALVLNSANYTIIDSIKNTYKIQFNALLSASQSNQYYKEATATKANTTATLMAAMLRNKYNVDATMQQYFSSIINWREAAIEKIWLQTSDSTTRSNHLAYTFYIYDSLLSVYTNAAASSNYFSSRVYFLDSIAPIDSIKKVALATTYYNNCIQFKYRAYADNFNIALNTVFNRVADTPYYAALYKNELQRTTINAINTVITNYSRQNQISTLTAQLITQPLIKQQRIIALVNKIFPNYTIAKDSIIDTLTVSYQKQIDSLLAHDVNINNATQLDLAIRYAVELGSNPDQIDLIKIHLTTLNTLQAEYKQTNTGADYDSKPYESSKLNTVLTAEQYTQLLTTKCYQTATNLALKGWNELVRLNLNNDYDPVITKIELTNYHLAVLIAYYRNAHETENQYIAIHSINEIMPDAMKTLINYWKNKTPYSDSPDTFFQW